MYLTGRAFLELCHDQSSAIYTSQTAACLFLHGISHPSGSRTLRYLALASHALRGVILDPPGNPAELSKVQAS
jgi:hypothetical protein